MSLKVGDLLEECEGIVIRELTFKEWTVQIDNQLLEYELENAWEHWQKSGPRFEVLKSDGTISYVWSK